MAYTALEKMRLANELKFGADVGPHQPTVSDDARTGFNLKSAVLRFIHERCEELRFDANTEEQEKVSGSYYGTGLEPNQVPYNMQMDVNRLCLERELERFLDSGATQDAYNVYYCFTEIFLGGYGKSKRMVELLSECEANASTLLMEHRDHYSHSVYVFALGLAIYETNANYRRAFNSFYHFDAAEDDAAQSHAAACFFLEFWGLASLFHDMGYPFELAFEQVMSYFDVNDDDRGDNAPFIAYKNPRPMTVLSSQAQDHFKQMYGKRFSAVHELLAHDIAQKLGAAYGFSENYLADLLQKKPTSPEYFAYYMDHAYFSAVRLYRGLEGIMEGDADSSGPPFTLQAAHVDALSAILLHYVVFRYSIAPCAGDSDPCLQKELHPLAWLLMLCDELQCWDRTAYGRNTRTVLNPMGAEFDFRNDRIVVMYQYDQDEQDKIDAYLQDCIAWKKGGKLGKEPKLKAYSNMAGERNRFLEEIEYLVDTSGVPLVVACVTAPVDRRGKRVYLSESSFLHMHDFAVALNASYAHEGHEDEVDAGELEAEFASLSLEYKLSNINQVKSFSKYLNAIRCFYTDRPVDFDTLSEFTSEQIALIAPMEHERWQRERKAMGWRNGDIYERASVPLGMDERTYRKALREQTRCNKLVMDGELTEERIREHYQGLSEQDKGKDWKPFNTMLKLIGRFDGLRIYQLPRHDDSASPAKPGRTL